MGQESQDRAIVDLLMAKNALEFFRGEHLDHPCLEDAVGFLDAALNRFPGYSERSARFSEDLARLKALMGKPCG